MNNNNARRAAEGMLLAATFFWGWTFPVMKEAVVAMPVFAFLAMRFALAGCLMTAFSRRPPPAAALPFGLSLGVALFLIFALQTWGLKYTSATNSGFITGLNVVWVLLARPGVWRKSLPQVVAVAAAVAGLWLLTSPSAFNIGDLLTLGCSVCVAAHILMLARRCESESSADLAAIQFWTVAVFSALCSLFVDGTEWVSAVSWDGQFFFALLLTAGGATVFSFWAQTHFQRRTTPLRAGLIFICEPVFAAAFAVGLYGERLPPQAWAGALLIFIAMLGATRTPAPAPAASKGPN